MADGALVEIWDSGLTRAADVLDSAGCDTPRLDAELLLAAALGTTRTRLYTMPPEPLDAALLARFDALLGRRAAREPVAYILGRKEFRQISLAVDRRVLVPRPETELLVEVGLTLRPGVRVADVGTGSGAVALALKHERPDLEVTGTDVEVDALAVARENGRSLGLDVRFLHADLLEGAGAFDAVLANLPYVVLGSELPPEIARYEPATALFGGADGLDTVRRLVRRLDGVEVVGLEVGAGQAGRVAELLAEAGFASIEPRQDLAGHDRVVIGRRSARGQRPEVGAPA